VYAPVAHTSAALVRDGKRNNSEARQNKSRKKILAIGAARSLALSQFPLKLTIAFNMN